MYSICICVNLCCSISEGTICQCVMHNVTNDMFATFGAHQMPSDFRLKEGWVSHREEEGGGGGGECGGSV